MGPQTRRLANARRTPLLQFKRCMGIAALQPGLIPARRPFDQFWHEDRTYRSPLQGRRFGRGRRCGAQVLSPILGYAHNNSRRCLTCHRGNIYSYKEHLQQATTSALLDRGNELKGERSIDFNSIRLVQQQLLEIACCPSCWRVIETKSMQDRMFGPGDFQGRLRACPFLGSWRALLCGEVMRVGAAGGGCSIFRKRRVVSVVFTPCV